jgi:hypothetical protein
MENLDYLDTYSDQIIDKIESIINDINSNNLIIYDNSSDSAIHIHFEIIEIIDTQNDATFQSEEENNYFKNCKEINNCIGKSHKIKKDDHIVNESCLICIEKYNVGEFKRYLPKCNHYFHKKCIDKWLRKNASCPICRDKLKKE